MEDKIEKVNPVNMDNKILRENIVKYKKTNNSDEFNKIISNNSKKNKDKKDKKLHAKYKNGGRIK